MDDNSNRSHIPVKMASDRQIRQKSLNKMSLEADRKRINPIDVQMRAVSNNKLQQTVK